MPRLTRLPTPRLQGKAAGRTAYRRQARRTEKGCQIRTINRSTQSRVAAPGSPRARLQNATWFALTSATGGT